VGFKKMTECVWWWTSTNARKQWVPNWGNINSETAGGKDWVDPRNQQQIGVKGAQRTCI